MKIFSFGTLQDPKVQKKLFGKTLTGKFDSISGWKVLQLEIADNDFYPRIVPDSKGIVFGAIYDIPKSEIPNLDKWEEKYVRQSLKTDAGITVDVYIMTKDIKSKKFIDFLDEISSTDKNLIEAIKEGYNTCFN